MQVHWNCPKCGMVNEDDWSFTAFPVCENCYSEIWWEDILKDSQLEQYLQETGG